MKAPLASLVILGSLAAAASFRDGSLQDVSLLPTHSNPSHTHIQFPVACPSCFSTPNATTPIDGYLLFSVQLTRRWGIDGPDACILNGAVTHESLFAGPSASYTPTLHYAYPAARLLLPPSPGSPDTTSPNTTNPNTNTKLAPALGLNLDFDVEVAGTATYHTLATNQTHTINALHFTVHTVHTWDPNSRH
ncbi:hypothetical protein AOQ84DRAFT_219836, partial [Glonium stellatum]